MLSRFKLTVSEQLVPVTSLLGKLGVRPNHVTFLALLSGFLAAYLISSGRPYAGALFLAVSAAFDALDGALARNEGMKSDFGGFLDSVLDRYVDVAVILAAGIYSESLLVSSIAMAGALLVSYTRARAEHIIEKCDVGIAERGERTLILIAGLLSGYVYYSLVIIAVISHLTALHRIYHTYSQSR
ncbi:CDP-alcohol phosphatidyltransferase family protein [Geoglobus ahangari]